MPLTFTALGSTLVVSIVDDNFKSIQDFCREGILKADFLATFDRYSVYRYTSGRLVSAVTFANPLLVDSLASTNGLIDITYRNGGEATDRGTIFPLVEDGIGATYAMELLGKPGPSLYHTWQEDGNAQPAGATGWPPNYWPINRYPKEYCYSRWLTVPHCSKRVYVDEGCVARLTATCKVSANMFRLLTAYDSGVAAPSPNDGNIINRRELHLGRFGLVVDTNPLLYTDEFTNANPNITDPISGATAPYVSWRVIEDRTFNMPQRAIIHLTAEVALKGRRWYNLSMKFRDAATHGWIKYTFGPPGIWMPGFWEAGSGLSNGPVYSAQIAALLLDAFGTVPADNMKFAVFPPWINLWENNALSVEFDYSRTRAYVYNSFDPDITYAP